MSVEVNKRQKISHSPSVGTEVIFANPPPTSPHFVETNELIDGNWAPVYSDSTANVCAAYGIMSEELTLPGELNDWDAGDLLDMSLPLDLVMTSSHVPVSSLPNNNFSSAAAAYPFPAMASNVAGMGTPFPAADAAVAAASPPLNAMPRKANINGTHRAQTPPGSGNHSDSDSSSDGSRAGAGNATNFKVGMTRRARKPRTAVDPNEPPEAKKERNKKSAADYRARRKTYVGELETRVEDLQGTVTSQKEHISSLGTENSLLKQQLAYFKNLLSMTQMRAKMSAVSTQVSQQFHAMEPMEKSGLVLFSLFSILLVCSPAGLNPTTHTYGRSVSTSTHNCGGRVLLGASEDLHMHDRTPLDSDLLHTWISRASCALIDCQANDTVSNSGRVVSDFTHLPVLMEDDHVRLTPLSLIIKHYYFPLGVKVIPLERIRNVSVYTITTEAWKYWGYSSGFWWSRDFSRVESTPHLLIEMDTWPRIVISTSDAQHVQNLIHQVGSGAAAA